MKTSWSFLLGLFLIARESLNAQVYINELMPSNVDKIMDDNYEFPDSWVELYNAGNESVDLRGWYLSNNKKDLQLWKIPVSCSIPAKGFKILYLDKEDFDLHANFRLDIKGEMLFLVKPDGKTIVDQLSQKFDKQEPNNAYGRVTDGAKEWGWFLTATPGTTNNSAKTVAADQVVPDVEFSLAGGLYDVPIEVSLSPKKKASTFRDCIYYTIDGTEPTVLSNHYSEPISIDSTTILHARIIHEDYLERTSAAQSYLYPGRELNLPVVSLTLDPRYLWDDTIGIYVKGENGAYFDKLKDYFNWQHDWRRPMHFEYFVDGENVLNQLGEMRIMGGWSREYAQKSLALYANKRFGTKRFVYDFFQEKTPLDDGYKSISLRNSGQDFGRTFMRDAVNQYFAAGKIDIDYQAYQPAVVFINGEYWGIQNIRERSNDDFIVSNYGLEDIDLLEAFVTKNGDKDNFNEFYNKVKKGTLTAEDVEKYFDVVEHINYYILETFVSNQDWLGNNTVFWRNRDGGKWRWLLKDTDYSSNYAVAASYNSIQNMLNSEKPLPLIVKACLKTEPFRTQFIDRYTVYLGDIFRKEVTVALIDSFAQQIEPEIPFHRSRWEQTEAWWRTSIREMKSWMEKRPAHVYKHLQSVFELGTPIPTTVSFTSDPEPIEINGVPVDGDCFDGHFFTDRPMTITFKESSKKFGYWEIRRVDAEGNVTKEFVTDQTLNITLSDTTLQRVKIRAMMGWTVDNEQIHSHGSATMQIANISGGLRITVNESRPLLIYNLNGRLYRQLHLPIGGTDLSLPAGIYIIDDRKVVVR